MVSDNDACRDRPETEGCRCRPSVCLTLSLHPMLLKPTACLDPGATMAKSWISPGNKKPALVFAKNADPSVSHVLRPVSWFWKTTASLCWAAGTQDKPEYPRHCPHHPWTATVLKQTGSWSYAFAPHDYWIRHCGRYLCSLHDPPVICRGIESHGI